MRLLLVAPTCDAEDVGEAWIAHQWATRLAGRHEVTLLSYAKRGAASVASQVPDARVVEWAEPPLPERAERFNSMLKPAYLPFALRARRWIGQALAAGERFDLAFQPTPVAARYPSPLAGQGIPYILGPVGGSLNSPPGFAAEDTSAWFTRLRAVDQLRFRHDPFLRRSYLEADVVLGIAAYVRELLGELDLRRFEVMPDTALVEVATPTERVPHRGAVRLLYVGRLVRTKGARDAIGALQYLADLPVHLDVVGDGFDRAACEALADELGLRDRVTFHGAASKTAVQQFYCDADIFVFPSFREAGGIVVFEAMGAGLPLVVSDRGGPAASVSPECAVLVTPVDPAQYARAIADALRPLVEDAGLRTRMGAAAVERVRAIGLWRSKVEAWEEIARSVARSGSEE